MRERRMSRESSNHLKAGWLVFAPTPFSFIPKEDSVTMHLESANRSITITAGPSVSEPVKLCLNPRAVTPVVSMVLSHQGAIVQNGCKSTPSCVDKLDPQCSCTACCSPGQDRPQSQQSRPQEWHALLSHRLLSPSVVSTQSHPQGWQTHSQLLESAGHPSTVFARSRCQRGGIAPSRQGRTFSRTARASEVAWICWTRASCVYTT